MDYYEALKVRENWGDRYCSHPKLEKLYYTGAFLISYVCTSCGREFSIPEKMEFYDKRRKDEDDPAGLHTVTRSG